MSNAQARTDIMQHHVNAVAAADRAARLVEAIKAETRWLLLTATARSFPIDDQYSDEDRAQFIATWPGIRHRRLPAAWLGSFYDLVADQASTFAHLIEIRRQRAADRRAQ